MIIFTPATNMHMISIIEFYVIFNLLKLDIVSTATLWFMQSRECCKGYQFVDMFHII